MLLRLWDGHPRASEGCLVGDVKLGPPVTILVRMARLDVVDDVLVGASCCVRLVNQGEDVGLERDRNKASALMSESP